MNQDAILNAIGDILREEKLATDTKLSELAQSIKSDLGKIDGSHLLKGIIANLLESQVGAIRSHVDTIALRKSKASSVHAELHPLVAKAIGASE